MEIFLGAGTDHGVSRKDLDAVMAVSDTEFIFRANHTEGFHATYLGFLYLEITRKNGSESGKQDFLSGCHVRCSADYGKRLARTIIDLGNMEMVGIRMSFTLKYFRHYNAGKTAGDLFFLRYGINFNSDGCHGISNLLRRKVALKIFFKPAI